MAEFGNSKIVDENGKTQEFTPEPPLYVKHLEAEDLAPDGGWGWVVAAGMTVTTLMTIAQGSAFGLIYSDFLDESGNGGSAMTALNLMMMMSFSLSGLSCNELLKRYCIKSVGVIGALIYAIANTAACLAPDVTTMAILFFIQGLGIGITMTVSNISFNAYFVKRRTKVLGIVQVITGLGTIAYPVVCEHLLTAYGFRGCVALLGALSFNTVISMFVMDPVHWHYKKPKFISSKESVKKDKEIGSENDYRNSVISEKSIADPIRRHSMDAGKGWEENRSIQSLRDNAEHEKPLLIDNSKTFHRSQDRHDSGVNVETGFRLRPRKGLSIEILANRISITGATSMTSINGIPPFCPISEIEEKDEITGKRRSIRSILGNFLETSLLRDPVFMNICIGSGVVFLTDILFGSFIPMTMASQGYTKSDIALVLTVLGISELAGKILFMTFAMFFNTKARYVFLGAVYCLVCCRIAFLYCDSLMMTITVIGCAGISRSWYGVTQTLVIAEYVKIEKFAAAWGISTVINGLSAIIVCPLIGFVKDFTQSYVITQYVLLGGLMVCLVPWTIEILIYDVLGRKKRSNTVNLK